MPSAREREAEIVVYLGNAGIFKINGKEYLIRRGDIALINMFDPHTLIYNKNTYYERFSISIDPNLLLSFNTAQSNLLDIFSKDSRNYIRIIIGTAVICVLIGITFRLAVVIVGFLCAIVFPVTW